MSPAGGLAILIALLGCAAFFAASEVGFLAVGVTRVRELVDAGSQSARFLLFLRRHRSLALSTMLVGVTASNYMAERLAVAYAIGINPVVGPIVAAIVMTVVVLVFAEVTPIQFAARNPERVALLSALPVAITAVVISPVILLMSLLSRVLLRVFGIHARTVLPSVTEEHLMAMIEQSEEQGSIEPMERRMMRGVLEFGDYTVGQIMTPRPDVDCVEESQSLAEGIVGVLHLKDLLPAAFADDLDAPVHTVMRTAFHVPESLPADELLKQLQRQRLMIAIVKDEYGGTAGIVTVEDLLEEIVGEIRDEFDDEEPELLELAPGEFRCNARVSLHELEAHLHHTHLPTDEYDSLAGLVMDIAGHIPQVEETLCFTNLVLVVERMDGQRIETIRVTEHPAGAPPQASLEGES